jgi:hypothetical protein
VVLLVGMSGPVAVANVEVFYGGNELYKWCSKELAAFESSFCGGFITGVTDSMLYGSVYGFRSCHSKDVSISQTVDVVKVWLANNPVYRHLAAALAAARAMSETWPCK